MSRLQRESLRIPALFRFFRKALFNRFEICYDTQKPYAYWAESMHGRERQEIPRDFLPFFSVELHRTNRRGSLSKGLRKIYRNRAVFETDALKNRT